MDEMGEVRRLLATLRDRPMSVDETRLAERRARLLPELRAQVLSLHQERVRTRMLRRALAGAGVLAVAAAALFMSARAVHPRGGSAVDRGGVQADAKDLGSIRVEGSSGPAVFRAGGTEMPISTGETLPGRVDGELRTAAAGRVRVRTARGLLLALSGDTNLSLGGLSSPVGENQVRLSQGEVKCEVPKLNRGQHFEVVTPDARVVVHGTVFSVRVTPLGQVGQSCVRVQQGAVLVYTSSGEVALNGGDSWGCGEPSAATQKTSAEPEPSVALPESPKRNARAARSGRVAHSADTESVPGTLAQETELLQSALAAERTSDKGLAVDRLETLLRRYPNSPLAPEARRALTRVLGNSGGQ